MKIVYIHDTIAKVGGVERVFAENMNYLADVFGYEVYLITSIQGKPPSRMFYGIVRKIS